MWSSWVLLCVVGCAVVVRVVSVGVPVCVFVYVVLFRCSVAVVLCCCVIV